VTGTVMMMLRRTGKVAAGALSVALAARLGWPALGALAFLVVLATGVACWVISDDDRSKRVTRILTAWRGGIISPEPDAPAISPPDR
jgi:hypothetical protein